MADFRIKHGLALGPYGTVGATSGGGTAPNLLPPGDTTPDVSLGSYFLTANTTATTITYFDGDNSGRNTPEEGKLVFILFRDSLTTIANAGQINLAESGGAFQSGDTLTLVHHNSSWYELSRSANNQSKVLTQSIAGSASFSVDNVSTVLLNSTSATAVLSSLSGGNVGQEVTIILNTGGVATRIANTAGNLALGGTAWTTLVHPRAYKFVKVGSGSVANMWSLIGGVNVP